MLEILKKDCPLERHLHCVKSNYQSSLSGAVTIYRKSSSRVVCTMWEEQVEACTVTMVCTVAWDWSRAAQLTTPVLHWTLTAAVVNTCQ